MKADNLISMPAARDAEWLARHAELDTALAAVIRTKVVDERFDEQVWAKVRAAEAETSTMLKSLRRKLGVPWWLDCLNVIAIVATLVAVAPAFGPTLATVLANLAGVALAAVEPSSEPVRVVALVAGAAAVWFALRTAVLGAARSRPR